MQSDRIGAHLERSLVFRDGDRIVAAGDVGEEMFVVARGAIRVSRTRADGTVVDLGLVERGEFFGEMSLLEGLPRDADGHAVGETHVLAIGPGALLSRLRRDPTIALELLHHLSRRLREANARLADTD